MSKLVEAAFKAKDLLEANKPPIFNGGIVETVSRTGFKRRSKAIIRSDTLLHGFPHMRRPWHSLGPVFSYWLRSPTFTDVHKALTSLQSSTLTEEWFMPSSTLFTTNNGSQSRSDFQNKTTA
jgi:hypothetical protein